MPARLIIDLQSDKELPYNYSLSTAFQGYLMEQIDTDFAEKMHNSGYHPYSRFVTKTEVNIRWTVNALDEEVEKYIIKKLLADEVESIHINKLDDDLKIISKEYSVITLDEGKGEA